MKLRILITLAVVLGMTGIASAADTIDTAWDNINVAEADWAEEGIWTNWYLGYVPSSTQSLTVGAETYTLDVGNTSEAQHRDGTWVSEADYDAVSGTTYSSADLHTNQDPDYSLTISGLTVGRDYTFKSYSNHDSSLSSDMSLWVGVSEVDSGTIAGGGASSWSDVLQLDYTWCEDDGTITFEWEAPADSQSDVYLNGFTLVPEPATVALLGMGSLVLLRRRRK